jgi:dihydrofolate reductase
MAQQQTKKTVIIMAITREGGISYEGNIPWNIRNDMNHFKKVTSTVFNNDDGNTKNAVIMGYNTFESLRTKPLQNRVNIVLTRNSDDKKLSKYQTDPFHGIHFTQTLSAAFKIAREDACVESIFIIGGSSVYNEVLSSPVAYSIDEIDISYIHNDDTQIKCDNFVNIELIKNIKGYVKHTCIIDQIDPLNIDLKGNYIEEKVVYIKESLWNF